MQLLTNITKVVIVGGMCTDRLTPLRNRAHMSRYELAGKAGVTYNTLVKIERGSMPRQDTLIALTYVLADRLEQTPSEVLAELTGVNDTTSVKEVAA